VSPVKMRKEGTQGIVGLWHFAVVGNAWDWFLDSSVRLDFEAQVEKDHLRHKYRSQN
jgi:hypothetical protein